MSKNRRQDVTITISPKEIEILKLHTHISKPLIKKMIDILKVAKGERNCVKWVKVTYSLKELDNIIASIVSKANDRTSTASVQCELDNMFSRFADKYNNHVIREKINVVQKHKML